jgi:hypothetical protein
MKHVPYIIIILLAVCLSITFYLHRKEGKKTSGQLTALQSSLESACTAFSENVLMNTQSIPLACRRFCNESGDTIDIGSIFIPGDTKVAIRIKDDECMDCIDSALSKVNGIVSVIGQNNIILLTSYHNSRELTSMKKTRNIPYKIYNTITPLFNKSIEDARLPAAFLLDSSLSARSFCFLRSTAGKVSDLYFNSIYRYFRAFYSSRYPITMPQTSSISFSKQNFDFGNIGYKEPASVNATFRNSGKKPLVITAVTTGCSCTQAKFEQAPIMPNDSAVISISYDARRVGFFERTVMVFSNAVEGPVALHIQGFVKTSS